MTLPVFLLIEATQNPEQKEALQSYLSKAPAITKSHGAVPVASYDVESVLDQGDKPGLFAVISFPNRDAITALFDDPAYKALIPERDLGFNSIRYFITNERV